mgnify:CR=1 FL=1
MLLVKSKDFLRNKTPEIIKVKGNKGIISSSLPIPNLSGLEMLLL